MLHGEKEWTKGGNPRAPPMNVYLQWIVDAWEGINKEVISQSFKVCGITNAEDGSEDSEIHCFKENGPIPTGRALLTKAREKAEEIDFEKIIQEVDEFDKESSK
jgi:hypothetical protein